MTDQVFDASRAGPYQASITGGRFMRISGQRMLSAAFLAAVFVATRAFADEPPKTDKILFSEHRGDATIIMISGVDTDRAVVMFKREIDDIVEDCVRTGDVNEAYEVSSDEVVKCTKESLKVWSKEVRTRRANCSRSTLFIESGNYTLIDYVKEEDRRVRINWKSHKDNTIIDHCTACHTSELLDTYRVLCPSRYKAAFNGLDPY